MKRIVVLVFIFSNLMLGQSLTTGSLELDFMAGSGSAKTKSPLKAGILSAVVPGSGELYAGSYLKSALFFAIEVTAWSFYLIYDRKGDRQTEFYHRYADEHWSVVKYAQWLNEWVKQWGDIYGIDYTKYAVPIDPNTELPPWERVDWKKLNELERIIGGSATGFTHTLPPHGEQQYYELIGKYSQYVPGWDDFLINPAELKNLDELSPTARFVYYSKQRGKANDLYTIATTATFVVIINHMVSAFDAALTAVSHNKVRLKSRVSYIRGVGFVASAKLKIAF